MSSGKLTDKVKEGKEEFGLRGFKGLRFRISPSKSFESEGVWRWVVQVNRDGKWLDFSKGTDKELEQEII